MAAVASCLGLCTLAPAASAQTVVTPGSGAFSPAEPRATEGGTDAADGETRREARDAFADKQFVRAWRLDPAAYPALEGVDAPSISVDTAYRSHTGDAEKSPASGFGGLVTASATRGVDVFGVQADYLSLHSSAEASSTIAGAGPRIPAANLRGVEPGVFWRRENAYAPLVEIGSTPFGGLIDPTVTGRLGLTLPVIDDLQLQLELSRAAVTDSIASYTGVRDPLTGRSFGRVVESAAKAKVDWTFARRWSLAVTETAGERTGERVRDTFHEELEVAVAYDFRVPGFSSFALGPQYDFEHFSRDQESVALGSGGYYSPHSLSRLGIGLDFVTREARRWVVSGTFEPALQREHEFGESASYQGAISSDFAASYQLASHVALGALLHADSSREYGEFYVGVGLKLSLAGRSALLSTDFGRSALH